MSERQARRRLQEGGKPVVLQFFAPWCGACQETHPEIEKLQGMLCGDADVIKVNVDTASKLADEHGIEALPTVAVFKDGKLVKKSVGGDKAESFARMARRAMAKGSAKKGKK